MKIQNCSWEEAEKIPIGYNLAFFVTIFLITELNSFQKVYFFSLFQVHNLSWLSWPNIFLIKEGNLYPCNDVIWILFLCCCHLLHIILVLVYSSRNSLLCFSNAVFSTGLAGNLIYFFLLLILHNFLFRVTAILNYK